MHLKKRAFGIFAAGLIGLGMSSSARAADEYKIKLDRPYKVGDSFDVSSTVTVKSTHKMTADGKTSQEKDDYTCVLEGTETVQAVTENSRQPQKLVFKVKKCLQNDKPLVPEGTEITAENTEGHTQVTIDGSAPADKKVAAVLNDLFDTTNPNSPSGDEQMGTESPQKVGGTWKVNSEAIAKSLAQDVPTLTADNFKGTGTLDDVSEVDGKKVEKVTVKMEGSADKKEMPHGVTLSDWKMKLDVAQTFPVDESGKPTDVSVKMTMSMTFSGPGGTMEINVDRKEVSKYSPSK